MRHIRTSHRFAWLLAAAVVLTACNGGGGKGGSAVPAPAPTGSQVGVVPGTQPTVAPSPVASAGANAAAFSCPTSDSVAAVAARTAGAEDARRFTPRLAPPNTAGTAAATQLVAVTYDVRSMPAQRSALAAHETALGARLTRELTFTRSRAIVRVLAVPAAQTARVEAALRATAGVRSVGLTGAPRYATSVTQPYFPDDPYFSGFQTTEAGTTGTVPPATFEVEPLVESANVPGQWDMHVTRLEYAFAYGQAGNGSSVSAPGALGSTAVKLAVIDTGEDATHPELAPQIVYQRCFITNPGTRVQSTSTFSTDEDGHGTDVAGIADAATNNGLGFAAAAGDVSLYAYRVFPTPDDNCRKTTSSDSQCSTNGLDIASAINDAVAAGVNVISLSLGGSACVNGADPDGAEGAAVADAIAANVIVVAAAGNAGGPPLEAPACDPGVIAVGATALADGSANGSKKAGGSASAPFEYVASYSDSGTPGSAPGSASAWGIVAPGGDPSGAYDPDDLHWVENIWTSTPFASSASDTAFLGNCSGDYGNASGSADCRVLIAGTSMATPHVAGAAALILSANASYQSPALMKRLLCGTADDIGDPQEGCGRLDVYRAMATAVGDPQAPGPQAIP